MAILGQDITDKTPWDIDKNECCICEHSREVSNELLSSSTAHFRTAASEVL